MDGVLTPDYYTFPKKVRPKRRYDTTKVRWWRDFLEHHGLKYIPRYKLHIPKEYNMCRITRRDHLPENKELL